LKKVGIILLCVFIVATFSYYYYITTDFSGDWDFEGTDKDFSLTIIQNGTTISGTHCSVLYGGKKIDCSIDESDPPSVTGTASDDDSVIVIFKSTVATRLGRQQSNESAQPKLHGTSRKNRKVSILLPSLQSLPNSNT
jgi:hypothetical protein